jgi:hypothetical protein
MGVTPGWAAGSGVVVATPVPPPGSWGAGVTSLGRVVEASGAALAALTCGRTGTKRMASNPIRRPREARSPVRSVSFTAGVEVSLNVPTLTHRPWFADWSSLSLAHPSIDLIRYTAFRVVAFLDGTLTTTR